MNGAAYWNANLVAPSTTTYTGVEAGRLRYPTVNKLYSNIVAAYVIGNESVGYFVDGCRVAREVVQRRALHQARLQLRRRQEHPLTPAPVAGGSWTSNATAGDPNNPILAYSANSPADPLLRGDLQAV